MATKNNKTKKLPILEIMNYLAMGVVFIGIALVIIGGFEFLTVLIASGKPTNINPVFIGGIICLVVGGIMAIARSCIKKSTD
ncbi:hypothetical protein IJG27_02450 [Candidatus Saccharibacteria bacterium]|nr:hypothetical protein [Candidatus Saccharibacteria bacterium]